MNVLVIGGAGFIGTALIKRLVSDHNVTSLDNYTSGSKDNHVNGAAYIEGCSKDVGLYVSDADIVFHFGEYSRVEPSFDNQPLVFDSLVSLYSVLKFCQDKNAKLIYAGSSSGFAKYASHNLPPYTFIKKVNVDIINQFYQWNPGDYAVVYFYNAYGEGEIGDGDYCTVVEKFIRIKSLGKTPSVNGNGEQKRNFTYIQDIVDALILVMQKGSGDGYGIGCDESWSVNSLCQMLDIKPIYVDDAKGNRDFAPLNTKRTKGLGWHWKTSLPDYIKSRL